MRSFNSAPLYVALCTAFLTGCIQDLQQINKDLATFNRALAQGTSGNYGAGSIPTMTPQQEHSLANSFVRTPDSQIEKAVSEARPLIMEITKRIACYPEYDAWRVLGAYSTSTYRSGGSSPMTQVAYHPQSQCLSVVRIDDWKMPALNVLQYRVAYVSEQSGHSVSSIYRLVKQVDGQWLLDSGL